MNEFERYQQEVTNNGFAIINNVYEPSTIERLTAILETVDETKATVRKTAEVFAMRQVLKEMPVIAECIFSDRLRFIIKNLFREEYFVVKSIYFDKPGQSNWFVAYHQDLTISVDKKTDMQGFGPWTVKHNQFAVQPPLAVLQDNFTIRIHLDDCNEGNGALKVIPGSHLKSIYRPDKIDWTTESEFSCNVKAGGIMIMKPLLLHSSNRTVTNRRRRVLHIEFSRSVLPTGLNWSEYLPLN